MPIDPSNKYIGFYHIVMTTLACPVTFTEDHNKNPDPAKLWAALINLDKNQWKENIDNQNYQAMVRTIVRRLRPYVPEEYRITDSFSPLDKHEEVSLEHAKEFIEFCIDCINRLEDHLTINYVNNGAKKDLDILSRRYKANWGDSNSRSLEVKQTCSQDNKLEIHIVDA